MIHAIDIIKYWSLAAVPLAVVLFVLPCRLRIRHQARWIMFLLLCGIKGIVFEQFGGNALAPDLPEWLVWLWNWADGGLFFLVLLSLVWWVRKGRVWILPVLAWGIAAWGQYNGTAVPSVREVDLRFEDLPVSLDGYRIVQLSDLHCSSAARRWRTQAIVDRVNALQADLVCLTGDYVDGKCACLADDLKPLLSLKAKDGVYGVRGNHEYYGDWLSWRTWYAENGFRFLENECVFPHEGLALAGVPDEAGFQRCGIVGERDWWESFAAATNGEFRVLMCHRPKDVLQYVRECDIRLQLSGHTHGGIAPLLDLLVKLHNGGYVRGLYPAPGRSGDRYLYVSSGCGQWVGFPMRFFIPSEITLLTLRRGA